MIDKEIINQLITVLEHNTAAIDSLREDIINLRFQLNVGNYFPNIEYAGDQCELARNILEKIRKNNSE